MIPIIIQYDKNQETIKIKKISLHISIILFIYFEFQNKIWFLIFKKIENFKQST